jgi:hypothetical protein
MAPQFITGTIENMEMALDGSHKAQYGSAECGFPRSVRTDDTDELTRIDGKGNILEGNDAGKSERRVVKLNDRLV